MFYENHIEKIYIINGLARSGNHLFITWLLSTFNNNEVYYLNNIKPSHYGLISKKNIDINIILKYHAVTNDNKYGLKIDKTIRKKLVGIKDMIKFLYKKKKIKILIISMENKKINKINMLSNIFIKYNHIYKCIVIRDILNLFSSRIQSEKKLINKKYYETDKITIEYWLDNYNNIKKHNYIVFNYNKFLCYTVSRKSLANKLNIDYNKAKITLNLFGLTSGSSFTNNITNKSDYFMRWTKFKNNPLIKSLIQDNKIINILCKDFSMCLNFDKKKIKICKNIYNLE
tara:strand:+ start:832 stop:1689 length:858 start_codon:yes stop_codon:yes gene_type:complete